MRSVTWNEIPAELQRRVLTEGVPAIGELASWAYEKGPSLANDDLHDLLCAFIVFLLRAQGNAERRIRSIPAILTTIAYRQKCQRFRDKSNARPSRAPSEEPTPFAHLARLELCASIQSALQVLGPGEREAVVRKHLFDQSYREIARAMFGPDAGPRDEGRISVILSRARRKLRDQLGEENC